MAWVSLPLVIVVAAGNALQHAVWTLRFHEYAPGVVTGVALVIPAAAWVVRHAAVPGGAPRSYILGLSALAAYGAVETWHAGRSPLPALVALHAAIRTLGERVLGGP